MDRLLIDEPRALYDLEAEPGIRVALVRLSPREHVLILMMHHIICDWASEGIIWRELVGLVQIVSQRRSRSCCRPDDQRTGTTRRGSSTRLAERTSFAEDLAFWEETLRGAPPLLELPADRARPAMMSYRGGRHPLEAKQSISQRRCARPAGRKRPASSQFLPLHWTRCYTAIPGAMTFCWASHGRPRSAGTAIGGRLPASHTCAADQAVRRHDVPRSARPRSKGSAGPLYSSRRPFRSDRSETSAGAESELLIRCFRSCSTGAIAISICRSLGWTGLRSIRSWRQADTSKFDLFLFVTDMRR